MTPERMHHELKARFDKLDNSHRVYLNSVNIDNALEEGVRMYVDKYVHGLTDKRDGLERHQKNIDMLRTLVVHDRGVPVHNRVISFSDLSNPYRHFVSASAYPKDCPQLPWKVHMEHHGNIPMLLRDEHRGENKRFRTIPGVIRSAEMELIGTTEFRTADVSYIRKPARICIGGYDDIDGTPLQRTECDLPKDYHSAVVDFALEHLARVYNMEKLLKIVKDKIATAS